SERAALAFLTFEPDLSAKQSSKLAANCQPKPGPAITPAGAPIRLLESVKNCRLLVSGNSNSTVADRKCNHTFCPRQRRRIGAPATGNGTYPQFNVPELGKLERVRQQILQDLIESLRV